MNIVRGSWWGDAPGGVWGNFICWICKGPVVGQIYLISRKQLVVVVYRLSDWMS